MFLQNKKINGKTLLDIYKYIVQSQLNNQAYQTTKLSIYLIWYFIQNYIDLI